MTSSAAPGKAMKLRTSILAAGVVIGILISGGLELWRSAALANGTPAAAEGIELMGFIWAVVLGLPLNHLLILLIEPIAAVSMWFGIDPFHVLMLGIATPWTLIAWGVSRIVDWRSRSRPAPA